MHGQTSTTDSFGVANFHGLFITTDERVEILATHDDYIDGRIEVNFDRCITSSDRHEILHIPSDNMTDLSCHDKIWMENKRGKIICVDSSTSEILIDRGYAELLQ